MTNATLTIRQKTHAFLFGCNILPLGQLGELNAAYEDEFVKLFNLATTTFCWNSLEPNPGQFRFAEGSDEIWRRPPPDRVLAFCKKHGITMKGQPLMCAPWQPQWVPKDPPKTKEAYQKWFTTVAERYGSSVKIFDVVNESDRKNFCLYTPDKAYVGWAFQQAKRCFPAKTLLEINEGTGTNGRGRERDSYFHLIKGVVDQDMGIRSVGFQFHLYGLSTHFQGKLFPASQLLETYEQFGQLGLPLFITEITIPSTVRPGADGEALQAEAVANLYRLWFSVPKMAGIIYWNLADGAAFGNEGRVLAGLLDDRMREKPAYQALYQMVKREWNTQTQTVSDAQGKASFRGFYGTYDVVATTGGKTQTFEIVLAQKDTNTHKLTLE
ncbi:MAG: hypothetical protein A2286_13375 [Gammaproteobacteria bacterium RIFOXYA12_FULL_61_12]|nr:MAG: hypothetical protein A2286_13375 [Gammaproteobacteria bacterium RIFOXYA12_FULL_61_12]